MDYSLVPILAVVVGASLTALAGLVGSLIQAKRDHAKWLREKRLDAYTQLLTFLHHSIAMEADVADLTAKVDAATEANADSLKKALVATQAVVAKVGELRLGASSALTVLGPEYVERAARTVMRAKTKDELLAAEAALKAAMRRSLGISS